MVFFSYFPMKYILGNPIDVNGRLHEVGVILEDEHRSLLPIKFLIRLVEVLSPEVQSPILTEMSIYISMDLVLIMNLSEDETKAWPRVMIVPCAFLVLRALKE